MSAIGRQPGRRAAGSQGVLFEARALEVGRTPEARLRRVASRSLALAERTPRSERERRADEDRKTMERLRHWARELAARFGLRFRSIEPERDGIVEHYGICYADGRIYIRLRHARTGKLLKTSSLVDTLCHELGHLKHLDHSPRFWAFYRKILAEARRRGIYRPGPDPRRSERVFVQAGLFATDGSPPAARTRRHTR